MKARIAQAGAPCAIAGPQQEQLQAESSTYVRSTHVASASKRFRVYSAQKIIGGEDFVIYGAQHISNIPPLYPLLHPNSEVPKTNPQRTHLLNGLEPSNLTTITCDPTLNPRNCFKKHNLDQNCTLEPPMSPKSSNPLNLLTSESKQDG